MKKTRALACRLLLALGALLVVLMLGSSFGLPGALAQDLPPRPPAPPAPVPVDRSKDEKPDLPGRLTGTLIDARSEAPAPGVTIIIGSSSAVTDEHGNYDNPALPPGRYTLTIAAGQGRLVDGPVVVVVRSEETTVQHLRYERPLPRAGRR